MPDNIQLSPEEIINNFPVTTWIKTAPTRIKVITLEDIAAIGSSFTDLEGRTQQVALGRCLCVGFEGEQWTCSRSSLERDRYPVNEPDEEGYRLYQMKHPQPVSCFDIPFAFHLQIRGKIWQSQPNGGIVTWNGKRGSALDMRVIKREIFLATYTRSDLTEKNP